ncbi:MAG: HAD family hydrolase [Clostridia bacterium]
MYNKQCLLFDLDGTLLDSREIVITAVHKAAEQFVPGVYSREQVQARFGESFADFLREWKLSDNLDHEQVYRAYVEQAEELESQPVPLFAGVKESLVHVKQNGYRLGLVTNKQRSITLMNLEAAGIAELFEIIVTVDDVTCGKPAPEPIEKAMKLLEVGPEQTLMVGDSIYDLQAAQAADVPCAILEWYGPFQVVEPAMRASGLPELVEQLLKAKSIQQGNSGEQEQSDRLAGAKSMQRGGSLMPEQSDRLAGAKSVEPSQSKGRVV